MPIGRPGRELREKSVARRRARTRTREPRLPAARSISSIVVISDPSGCGVWSASGSSPSGGGGSTAGPFALRSHLSASSRAMRSMRGRVVSRCRALTSAEPGWVRSSMRRSRGSARSILFQTRRRGISSSSEVLEDRQDRANVLLVGGIAGVLFFDDVQEQVSVAASSKVARKAAKGGGQVADEADRVGDEDLAAPAGQPPRACACRAWRRACRRRGPRRRFRR